MRESIDPSFPVDVDAPWPNQPNSTHDTGSPLPPLFVETVSAGWRLAVKKPGLVAIAVCSPALSFGGEICLYWTKVSETQPILSRCVG